MKLTFADITKNRITFNSHETHNPYCDILELVINRDSFITYCIELATGTESMEYYSGENYVVNSDQRSTSRHYQVNHIPKKYISVWNALKEYYKNNYSK